jgi:hypothetical protein
VLGSKRYILFFVAISFSIPAIAFNPLNSAHRDPKISFKKYLARYQNSITKRNHDTAIDAAVPFKNLDTTHIVKWLSMTELASGFTRARDLRFLNTSSMPNFPRRSTWLYPDDGCFARAALENSNLQQWNFVVPNKIFVFGDLRVKTANSTSGDVAWWYHVVPIVRIGDAPYVLDPAIHPKAPMALMDWLKSMTKDLKSITVAICGSGSYAPDSQCNVALKDYDRNAMSDQNFYLDDEWYRVSDLGRDPNRELGDSPPW